MLDDEELYCSLTANVQQEQSMEVDECPWPQPKPMPTENMATNTTAGNDFDDLCSVPAPTTTEMVRECNPWLEEQQQPTTKLQPLNSIQVRFVWERHPDEILLKKGFREPIITEILESPFTVMVCHNQHGLRWIFVKPSSYETVKKRNAQLIKCEKAFSIFGNQTRFVLALK